MASGMGVQWSAGNGCVSGAPCPCEWEGLDSFGGAIGSKHHRFSIKIPWKSIDFVLGQSRNGFGTILPCTSVRGVAWATRIDNEGQTV